MAFGLLAQVATFAFATPIYCTFQLFQSITAVKPTPENIRIPRAVLKALPWVYLVGFALPTGLLLVPVSEQVSTDLKQVFIALWQPWPAYVSILLTVANTVFSPFTTNDRNVDGGRATLRSLRLVYAVAFANTALSHLVSWIIPLATVAAPVLFQDRFLASLHPLAVFAIPKPWEAPVVQVESVGAAVHAFLRWDYIIGSTSVLVWAVSLYRAAHRVVYGKAGCLGLYLKVAVLSVLVGPVGAAVELLWERDELVINELGGVKRVAPKEKKSA